MEGSVFISATLPADTLEYTSASILQPGMQYRIKLVAVSSVGESMGTVAVFQTQESSMACRQLKCKICRLVENSSPHFRFFFVCDYVTYVY